MTRRHFQNIPPIDPELERLIEHIRALPPMTPEERKEQRRSFAFGNCAIDNPAVTRELVDRVADANPITPVDPELARALEHDKNSLSSGCPHDLLERIPDDCSNDRRCVKCHAVFANCQSVFDDTDYSKIEYFGISRTPLQSPHLGHHYGPVHPGIVEYTLPK